MRRLVLGIGDDGQVQVDHDDFTGQELAAFAIITQDLALKVLKDGPPEHVQISRPVDSN